MEYGNVISVNVIDFGKKIFCINEYFEAELSPNIFFWDCSFGAFMHSVSMYTNPYFMTLP